VRFYLPAAGVLCLMSIVGAHPAPPAAPAANPAAASAASDPPSAAAASNSGEAARHAKRTACLKEAKTRKMIGAARNAYIKDCIAKR
jgi:hypothetical protein